MASPPFATQLHPIVRSLIEAVVADELDGGMGDESVLDDATRTLIRRLDHMPRYLGRPMMILTLTFDWMTVPYTGRRYRDLDRQRRKRELGRWKYANTGPMREFVKFYEKMGGFVYHSKVEGE